MNKISINILLHKEIYESFNLTVPPYRLTGNEHKKLVDEINEGHKKNNEPEKTGIIKDYYGIALQIVAFVEDIL